MSIKIHKLTAGFIASVVLVVGFMAAPPESLPTSFGTRKAAACSNNVYEIAWSVAGVYAGPPPHYQVSTMRDGQRIHGRHEGHRIHYKPGYGWVTSVYHGGQIDRWMRSDALRYIGCY